MIDQDGHIAIRSIAFPVPPVSTQAQDWSALLSATVLTLQQQSSQRVPTSVIAFSRLGFPGTKEERVLGKTDIGRRTARKRKQSSSRKRRRREGREAKPSPVSQSWEEDFDTHLLDHIQHYRATHGIQDYPSLIQR